MKNDIIYDELNELERRAYDLYYRHFSAEFCRYTKEEERFLLELAAKDAPRLNRIRILAHRDASKCN